MTPGQTLPRVMPSRRLPRQGAAGKMDNYFTHGVGLVFYFFVLWVFLQLAYASWGCKRASAKWTALVRTPFMQLIGIRWISAILVIVISLQIMLVITILGVSAYTGKPITFE